MKDIFTGYEEVTYHEAKALATLMHVYAESSLCPEPICFGYNHWSKFYYIAFEYQSVQIALNTRGDVVWIYTDLDTAEEHYFDDEEELMEYLDTLG